MMTEPIESAAVSVFAEHIGEQLSEERDRKTSLEARGVSLVTTSGAFTTLVLGIAAVAGGEGVTSVTRGLLILSLVAFVVAAVLAVLANKPEDYGEPTVDGLRNALDKLKDRGEAAGYRTTAKTQLKILETARSLNNKKAKLLRRGTWAQVAALGLVACAGIATLVG